MIIGKDKQKLIDMGAKMHSAHVIMLRIRNDLELIASDLEEKGVDVISDPYWRMFEDIGMCTSWSDHVDD